MLDHSQSASSVDWNGVDDDQLIQACLRAESGAWDALLARYSRLIYAIPLNFGLSHPIADEIFQETCVILIEKLSDLRDRGRLSSWLMTVTRRICLQFLRTQRADTLYDDLYDNLDAITSDAVGLDERLLRLERQELVWRAYATLDQRCQQLLNALFFTMPPQPYETIAAALNISVGSIGPIRARCLERMHQQILKLDPASAAS
jgi:RNA polymerase sigma factor (sigma-70 family)